MADDIKEASVAYSDPIKIKTWNPKKKFEDSIVSSDIGVTAVGNTADAITPMSSPIVGATTTKINDFDKYNEVDEFPPFKEISKERKAEAAMDKQRQLEFEASERQAQLEPRRQIMGAIVDVLPIPETDLEKRVKPPLKMVGKPVTKTSGFPSVTSDAANEVNAPEWTKRVQQSRLNSLGNKGYNASVEGEDTKLLDQVMAPTIGRKLRAVGPKIIDEAHLDDRRSGKSQPDAFHTPVMKSTELFRKKIAKNIFGAGEGNTSETWKELPRTVEKSPRIWFERAGVRNYESKDLQKTDERILTKGRDGLNRIKTPLGIETSSPPNTLGRFAKSEFTKAVKWATDVNNPNAPTLKEVGARAAKFTGRAAVETGKAALAGINELGKLGTPQYIPVSTFVRDKNGVVQRDAAGNPLMGRDVLRDAQGNPIAKNTVFSSMVQRNQAAVVGMRERGAQAKQGMASSALTQGNRMRTSIALTGQSNLYKNKIAGQGNAFAGAGGAQANNGKGAGMPHPAWLAAQSIRFVQGMGFYSTLTGKKLSPEEVKNLRKAWKEYFRLHPEIQAQTGGVGGVGNPFTSRKTGMLVSNGRRRL